MSLLVQRGERLAAREVAGEMVILSADDSSLFVLNDVGTTIWNAADAATPIEALADAVCAEYEVDPATALRDVEEFVRSLAAAGILSAVEQATK